MIHELKIKPEYFAAVVSGDKTFEIRNNADRNFKVGDTLLLMEWVWEDEDDAGTFTGNFVEKVVSYITDFEQKPGYVVLGLVNKREQELAAQLSDATRQCVVMAELLREAIGEVPQTQSFPSRCDAALAGKMPDRQDTEWTDATTSPVAADYCELQEQNDQLQSKHKVALDLLQESHEVMRRIIPPLPQDCAKRGDLLDRIEVALAGNQQNKPVTITETIRTAPERIWLQVGDSQGDSDYPFPEHHGDVTWCADSVVACEVPYVRADLAGHSKQPLDIVPEGWRLVPFTPTEEQWGGLARAIVFWMRSYPSNQHTPSTLVEFITSYGYAVPKWMEDESEFLAKNHVISKGTAATLIYKAMLADGPASQGGEPCATEPPSSSQA